MGFPNFWPDTADIFENGKFVGKAFLNSSAAEYQGPLPLRLAKMNEARRLWVERSEETSERIENGETIGINVYNVRYDLTILPATESAAIG
jgi:hypothetical protein